ncbi:hypothetical protein BU25DRAFT_424898 [Macroventuria anomochaeta]|uniref:Uncharacterized protein n=1 Tax=Macroventuria anomochaeta TaxID=301207 RepID=A0ACB6RN78_9PLEO|nr:uncharacterized protein BU25DRAFT_424898 [Macroventuria anomochaeta]KAF2623381.1 hypothetical protein BU25DRAFT_424898 [Macroventuria anomochaeta]
MILFQIVQTCGCNVPWYDCELECYCYECDEYFPMGGWQEVYCSVARHHIAMCDYDFSYDETSSDESIWHSRKLSTLMNHAPIDGDKGVRFRINRREHRLVDWDGAALSHLWSDLDIDHRGNSSVQHEWEVNARPDVWCRSCGRFKSEVQSLGSCPCSTGGAFSWPCWSKASDGHKWNSKLWEDRLLQEYLEGANVADSERAQEYLRVGHMLPSDGYYLDCGKLEQSYDF